MIRELVSKPSISSVDPLIDQPNRSVIDLLCGWAEDAGFRINVICVDEEAGKYNLVATRGPTVPPGETAKGLVLSGHTDTVPYDENTWNSDPFSATELGDRIFGLGTADMKSFLALALTASTTIRDSELQKPLTIIGTCDEESTMAGAKALMSTGIAPGKFAIIGEPTSLRPVRMHKGVLMEEIRLTGKSGHSSNPTLGQSALEGMHSLISRLLVHREEMMSMREEVFSVPHPTLNFGRIVGGDSANRICAVCKLWIDLRVLPGMQASKEREKIRHIAREVAEDHQLTVTFDDFDGAGAPGFCTHKSSKIVLAAEELSGAESEAVMFGTEAPYFSELGLETIVLGPGSIDVAHQPNEFLPKQSMQPTIELLQKMIRRFCV